MLGHFKLQQYMNYIMYKKYRPVHCVQTVHCVQKVQTSTLCTKSTDQYIVYKKYRPVHCVQKVQTSKLCTESIGIRWFTESRDVLNAVLRKGFSNPYLSRYNSISLYCQCQNRTQSCELSMPNQWARSR